MANLKKPRVRRLKALDTDLDDSSDNDLRAALDAEMPEEPIYCYHVVSMRAGDESPVSRGYTCSEDLRKAVSDLVNNPCAPLWLFVFNGDRLHITKGPYRYLLSADDRAIPLFDIPEPTDLEVEQDGLLSPASVFDDIRDTEEVADSSPELSDESYEDLPLPDFGDVVSVPDGAA